MVSNRLRFWISLLLLSAAVMFTAVVSEEAEAEDGREEEQPFSEPKELEQCKAINKGKWCTCRKLSKFVTEKVGKEFGLFFPTVRTICLLDRGGYPSSKIGHRFFLFVVVVAVWSLEAEAVWSEAMSRISLLVRSSENRPSENEAKCRLHRLIKAHLHIPLNKLDKY